MSRLWPAVFGLLNYNLNHNISNRDSELLTQSFQPTLECESTFNLKQIVFLGFIRSLLFMYVMLPPAASS